MTNQEIISNELTAHIENILSLIEKVEIEKEELEESLNSVLYEYDIALKAIEPWENTGLEPDIDALQSAIFTRDERLQQLEQQLNEARLV